MEESFAGGDVCVFFFKIFKLIWLPFPGPLLLLYSPQTGYKPNQSNCWIFTLDSCVPSIPRTTHTHPPAF
ncbi:hypothetical protein T439DRAFT_171641 [Meredithblackwellia eburnea MCA 4105]